MAGKSLVVLSEETYARFDACVHCGLCLPACPTYVETQDEADSPRGRVHLMRAVVDGRIEPSERVFEHLDRCLVCRACETACPSSVVYHELIEAVRPQVAEAVLGKGKRVRSGMLQWMVGTVLPHAGRAKAAMMPLKVARKIGLGAVAEKVAGMMGGTARAMAAVQNGTAKEIATFTPAKGKMRGSVVLLRGCVGSVVSGDVNAACVSVMSENGFDVHVMANEPCCGALAAHGNDPQAAREFAVRLVDALSGTDADYFVSPIAGCGAQLKSLHKTVGDSPAYAEKTAGIVKRMRDVTQFLSEVRIKVPTRRVERTVAYHDPCHLVHGQKISEQPRYLLSLVPGLKIVPLVESDMCCGAAGTYNLNQPEMAERLGRRKVEHILESGAEELVTANVGCAMQIARHLREAGKEMPVRHVVELLAEGYGKS